MPSITNRPAMLAQRAARAASAPDPLAATELTASVPSTIARVITAAPATLPPHIVSALEGLVVDRQGVMPRAHMTTTAIQGHVDPGIAYSMTGAGLVATGQPGVVRPQPVPSGPLPPFAEVRGRWIEASGGVADDGNILGGNGTFQAESADPVRIPGVIATPEALSHYGAVLYQMGDVVTFHGDEAMPVTTMDVGENYVEGYLNRADRGGGVYIEEHDRPHFHMPMRADAAGHLLLGRRTENGLALTGFQIPYGSAIYSPPYVLHDDGFLIGEYRVVYSVTEDFSTVIFRQPDGRPLTLRTEATGD